MSKLEDKINDKMTTKDVVKMLVEELTENRKITEDLELKIDGVTSILGAMNAEISRMASSFRPVETISSQNQANRYGTNTGVPRQTQISYRFEWKRCDHERFPDLDADEYCFLENTPDNIKKLALDRVTQDGWRYWISKTQKYIYRKQT